MKPTRPRIRPAGSRHYHEPNSYPSVEAQIHKNQRCYEDLDNMTHHMEFEDIGQRPTSDVIKGGRNAG